LRALVTFTADEALAKYERARMLLGEIATVDAFKDVSNLLEQAKLYARQAGDRELEIKAAQVRFRAERRLGEVLKAAKDAGQLAEGRPKKTDKENGPSEGTFPRVTLKEAGIEKNLSSWAQRLARMDEEQFAHALAQREEDMRAGRAKIATDLHQVNAEVENRRARRELAIALSNTSAELPTGKQYPVIYADPPWHRNQGVTNRSYENHYPTMSWAEICSLQVKHRVLPDAWLFLWIPRAHAFALHAVETEAVAVETGEVVRVKVDMPLAYAVAKSWGFEAYSTAFVWTKTDEDHPDEAGGAVLVRDQDELLLLFKRGRGLPKPAGGEKFGSNQPLPLHFRQRSAAASVAPRRMLSPTSFSALTAVFEFVPRNLHDAAAAARIFGLVRRDLVALAPFVPRRAHRRGHGLVLSRSSRMISTSSLASISTRSAPPCSTGETGIPASPASAWSTAFAWELSAAWLPQRSQPTGGGFSASNRANISSTGTPLPAIVAIMRR
jgi:hypothetical protein